MSKTLIISHGDKGGCGKSHIAMIVASELSASLSEILLIDADPPDNDEGSGDVASRFASDAFHDHVQTLSIPLTGEHGDSELRVGEMLDLIEDSSASVVLINLPANASQTLEEQGGLLADMVAEFGHRLYVLYSFEPVSSSVSGAVASAEGAIMGAAERVCLVRNEHFGSVAEYDALIENHPALAGFPRVTVPALGDRGVKALKAHPDCDLLMLANDASRGLRWTLRKTLGGYQRRSAEAIFDALAIDLGVEEDERSPATPEIF